MLSLLTSYLPFFYQSHIFLIQMINNLSPKNRQIVEEYLKNKLTDTGSEKLKTGVVSIQYMSDSLYIGEIDEENRKNGNGLYKYSNSDIYAGEWKSDMLDGQGLYIFGNGDSVVGEFRDGSIVSGQYTYLNGDFYEGSIKEGKKDGEGVIRYSDGSVYSGKWKDGKRHGYGKIETNSYTYTGEWQNDQINGQGKVLGENYQFEGIVCNNILVKGKISITFNENQSFSGDLFKSKISGEGRYIFDKLTEYRGSFFNNSINGKGILTTLFGKYEGELKNSVFEGKGRYSFSNGELYQGQWKNGKKHGFGVYVYENGDKYQGNFHEDKKQGEGRYFWRENSITYFGMFSNDQIAHQPSHRKGIQLNFLNGSHSPNKSIINKSLQQHSFVFC